jgi:hypothetical protein
VYGQLILALYVTFRSELCLEVGTKKNGLKIKKNII